MKRKISIFESSKATIPCNTIPIIRWLTNIPSCIRDQIDTLRNSTDIETRKALKKVLPVATISRVFKERKREGLIEHTGLICIDIDGKDNPYYNVEEMKKIIAKFPFTMYCGLSVGGKGLFCIIQISEPIKHLNHFLALQKDFADVGLIIDPACKDITRLRIISYDDNAFFNEEATEYSKCLENSVIRHTHKESMSDDRSCLIQTRSIPKEVKIDQIQDIDYFINQMINPPIDRYPFNLPIETLGRQRGIYNMLEQAIMKRIDITEIYSDWVFICSLIAMNFGEIGRNLFLRTSQFYPNFTEEECNRLYDGILDKEYTPSTKTLSILLQCYGV